MADSLLQAYAPLLLWSGLGLILVRLLPDKLPRWLGRSLYWVGIPLEIFSLARQTDFSNSIGIVPLVTVAALFLGLGLAWLSLKGVQTLVTLPDPTLVAAVAEGQPSEASVQTTDMGLPEGLAPSLVEENLLGWGDRPRQGSFLLSSILGNTGFVGLAIAPSFVNESFLSWIVFYSVAHNVIGTYGLGVFLSSYFGRPRYANRWWVQIRDVLTVPSLWAFVLGYLTHTVPAPAVVDVGLRLSIKVVIPVALLLMGMRLSQLQGWKSLRLALVPTGLKILVIPALVGLAATGLGLPAPARLALVLMAGMPTAFAGLILAEEYELDRELIASSILLSTGLLLLTIPLWLVIFGDGWAAQSFL